MKFSTFFSDDTNAKLATLIIASPLAEEEKHCWFELLPLMNAQEKDILQKNLEEEIDDFIKLQDESLKSLTNSVMTP